MDKNYYYHRSNRSRAAESSRDMKQDLRAA
jgi:hypothetical protein